MRLANLFSLGSLTISAGLLCSDAAEPGATMAPAPVELAAARAAPDPKNVRVAYRRVATTLWVIGTWSAGGSPDSIFTRVRIPGDTIQHKLRGTAVKDSFAVNAPLPGASIAGFFDVRSKRRGLLSNWVPRSWSYTEPDAPPPDPVVESLFVRPVSFSVEATIEGVPPGPKNQHPVCALVGFQSGRVGFRRVYEAQIPYCDSTYKALPATVRAVTAAEQAVADGFCVDWSRSTGGTVTPELCPGSVGIRKSPTYKVAGGLVTVTPPSLKSLWEARKWKENLPVTLPKPIS